MKGLSALLPLLLAAPAVAQQSTARFDFVAYAGESDARPLPAGHYANPVLPGFRPDPSIVKVGQDFYLVTSTFAWFPGIPVYHSRDLVNWRQIGNAIDRPEMLDFSGLALDRGVFAPTIEYHDGTYYILNTCVGCRDNFVLTAKDPAGPWSGPHWLEFGGIDPSIYFEDGRAWIVNNDAPPGKPEYDGHRALWMQEIDLATFKMKGPRHLLVDKGVDPSTKPIWAEGPHIYKVDGWYYLLAAEGGTADQHSQTIYRSRTLTGPYTPGPVNPILTQRDLPEDRPNPVQATGHADFVKLDDGCWWAVFLATRPFRGQETLLGRETFLLPVTWKDGWPLILPARTPLPASVARPKLPASPSDEPASWVEEFDTSKLTADWLMLRTPKGAPWWRISGGALTLDARPVAAGALAQPSYIGKRMRHAKASWTTRVTFESTDGSERAGLLAVADENHLMFAGLEGDKLVVRRRISKEEPENGVVVAAVPRGGATEVDLKLSFDKGVAQAEWRPVGDTAWRSIARDIDVSRLATIHAGLFMGLVVGPHAASTP